MGDTAQRERDLAVDLESGGTTSDEDGARDVVPGITKAKKLLGRVWKGEGDLNSANYSELNSSDAFENLGLLAPDKKFGGEEKVGKDVKRETPRKKSGKKPPKPPRPPKSPSLDAADKKLVKEINELAMLKRARMERMKALKKMKAAKAASSGSSSSNLCAMVITILFCLIIILQGILLFEFCKGFYFSANESQLMCTLSIFFLISDCYAYSGFCYLGIFDIYECFSNRNSSPSLWVTDNASEPL